MLQLASNGNCLADHHLPDPINVFNGQSRISAFFESVNRFFSIQLRLQFKLYITDISRFHNKDLNKLNKTVRIDFDSISIY